jgi:hypothetical protein
MPRLSTMRKRSLEAGTRYRRYRPEDLQAALDQVRVSKTLLADAAAMHGVPRETLRRHLTQGAIAVRSGPRSILTAAEEADLVYYLLRMADLGLALDRAMVAEAVLQMVSMDGKRKHPWSHPTSSGPGRDWWESFLDRHPELAMRRARALDRTRATMSNTDVVSHFFVCMERAMVGVRPEMMFNMDETKVDGKQPRVVARKGARSVHALADPMMAHISLVACVNATGTHVMPPALVTQGANVNVAWYDARQQDLLWATSESGWMESAMFVSWLRHFVEFAKPLRVAGADGKLEPVLLLLDGHSTHVTFEAIVLAERNGVRLVKLPAHTTHVLQPLDLAVFGPWHRHWGKARHAFRVCRPRTVITKQVFAVLFRKPWDAALSPANIKNGFRAAGIVPWDPSVVLQHFNAAPTPGSVLDVQPELGRTVSMLQAGWPEPPTPLDRRPTQQSAVSGHVPVRPVRAMCMRTHAYRYCV